MRLPSSGSAARVHGLDAVRAIALILGVLLHATMSFLPGPAVWLVTDVQRSAVPAVVFFVIHVLRMTTFFVLAGFAARILVRRHGVRGTVRDRLRRIALPLVLAWPVMFAAVLLAAAAATGDLRRVTLPPLSVQAVPLTHLWFLYLLLLTYPALLALHGAARALDPRGGWRQRVSGWLDRVPLVPLLVLPVPVTALALYHHPYWLMWFGVPTPDTSLLPNRAALATYGTAMLVGWLLHRQQDAWIPWVRRAVRWTLPMAVLATTACLWYLGPVPVLFPAPFGTGKALYAAGYAVAVWSAALAMLGVGLRWFDQPSPAWRTLVDASYWVYLAHLPLVLALQVLVAGWPLPWWLKLPLITATTLWLLVWLHQRVVRHTIIGVLLTGRRSPRPMSPAP